MTGIRALGMPPPGRQPGGAKGRPPSSGREKAHNQAPPSAGRSPWSLEAGFPGRQDPAVVRILTTLDDPRRGSPRRARTPASAHRAMRWPGRTSCRPSGDALDKERSFRDDTSPWDTRRARISARREHRWPAARAQVTRRASIWTGLASVLPTGEVASTWRCSSSSWSLGASASRCTSTLMRS